MESNRCKVVPPPPRPPSWGLLAISAKPQPQAKALKNRLWVSCTPPSDETVALRATISILNCSYSSITELVCTVSISIGGRKHAQTWDAHAAMVNKEVCFCCQLHADQPRYEPRARKLRHLQLPCYSPARSTICRSHVARAVVHVRCHSHVARAVAHVRFHSRYRQYR